MKTTCDHCQRETLEVSLEDCTTASKEFPLYGLCRGCKEVSYFDQNDINQLLSAELLETKNTLALLLEKIENFDSDFTSPSWK